MSEFDERFAGTARIYGEVALAQFRQSHVCVLGIGGVGSWVAEALVRSGIGELTLVDLDDICVTNTNRQIHALESTIGQSKTAAMADRLRDINPLCLIHEERVFINSENVREILTPQLDYVVDAIDSVSDKAAVIASCKRSKINIISIGGAGGQWDPTCVAVADLSRTRNDPLAAKVRSKLRRDYGFSRSGKRFCVDCVYSTEQLKYPQGDGNVDTTKTASAEGGLDCNTGFGAATVVTTTFAMVAAAKVLTKLMLKANAS
ncbi:MAG: tRNA cyclic N6-threonylcarbamoyladenosine(37) synthase TcdA [Pseudomonadales bacterium]|nr:tRNA cyclic N6-threonylcarbamoyladenosine(37) synthase TcdA [Pseudomonadales bacterium]NRA13938.1 tRNA cyclic N6-threonylcarbamoyladenosine(37) synthase TcdA [Oceanospirillaceae bacterium]